MAAGHRYFSNPKSLAFTALCGLLLAVLVLWGFGKLKADSYTRLVPLAVELQVIVEQQQNLLLQYDYGYGFNQSHQQLKGLTPQVQPQTISFSISTWKTPRALRLVAAHADRVSVQAVNLQRGDSIVRLIAPERPTGQPDSVVLLLDDLPALMQDKSRP